MSQNVTWRQRRAIAELLTGKGTKQDAAAAAGVTRQTLWRWQQEPAFQQALKDAIADAIADISAQLVRLAGKATPAIERTLDATDNENVRLRAAFGILDRMLAIAELADIERRLAELEQGR